MKAQKPEKAGTCLILEPFSNPAPDDKIEMYILERGIEIRCTASTASQAFADLFIEVQRWYREHHPDCIVFAAHGRGTAMHIAVLLKSDIQEFLDKVA